MLKSYKNPAVASWCNIGDKEYFFRSRWEANYGRYLQFQKERGWIKDWKHEPKTFWFQGIKRGVVSYKPDFQVIYNEPKEDQSTHHWVEVKGYFDAKSVTKIKRFGSYYPHEKLMVIDKTWFQNNNSKMKLLIPTWTIGKK